MDIASLLSPGMGLCWRVVETQEVAATREITRSATDQQRLEQLLDTVKPDRPPACEGLSYLLMTPFRYPPLRYGSRYGASWERGLFYSASELHTAFGETAVYAWLFQRGPVDAGPLETIRDQRTAFSVRLRSAKTVDLRREPFREYHSRLTDPASWQYTQQLGTQLREAGTECFWAPSARLPGATNVVVIAPEAFATSEPEQQQHWHIRVSLESCWFGRKEESVEFQRGDFEVEGRIPHPCL